MESNLVSIVIPIYRTEQYLNRCIQSVVNQTYKNLEIILVDDGSPDNCPKMCEEWAQKDSRIKVVHKVNAGLGMARNTGIDHATGEYICFFDSDDYVELDTIEHAYAAAKQNDADLVCFGMRFVNSKGKITGTRIPNCKERVFCSDEVRNSFLPKMIDCDPVTGWDYGIPMSAWSKLFSMRSIQKNNWRFVSEREILSEDFYSVLKLCAYVETVCVLPIVCYNYCQNNTSVTNSYRKDRFEKACHCYQEIKKMCEELCYPKEAIDGLGGTYLSLAITAIKQEVASANNIGKKRQAIRSMLHNELLQEVLKARKNNKIATKKKILFWAMRRRLTSLCYALAFAQNATT